MKSWNKKKVSVLYIVLLVLNLVATYYMTQAGRSMDVVSVMGMDVAISLLTGVISSFSNMCLIIMVVYSGRIGFITSLILILIQIPLNSLGMIRRHDASTLPGILNNVLVTVVIILIYRRNSRIAKLQVVELDRMMERQKGAERLFEQTATALVNAIDAKDEYSKGHSLRVAEYSQKIAEFIGKSEEECKEIYYAALLHDVGKIGIADSILGKKGKLTEEEYEIVKTHPSMSRQILSGISEYPYLSIGAYNHHERFDGKGYPEKLKGNDIPEISRIIAVADAYDAMSSNRSYRAALPQQIVREEIVKNAGTQFDPELAKIMQHLIDVDGEYQMKERAEVKELAGKNELVCGPYREEISEGILISGGITKIRLTSVPEDTTDNKKYIPTIILFDSLDGRVHDDERTIQDLNYYEFAEVWFDGNVVVTGARNSETTITANDNTPEPVDADSAETSYFVETVRYKDHVSIRIDNGAKSIRVIVALPDCTRYSYIALTGEHCHIRDVSIENADVEIDEEYIPRIAPMISYIDRIEGDIPNVQIDGYRYDHSKPIEATDGLEIRFHTLSLPTARLIWHCPFVVIYSSDDGAVNGKGYLEHALVRFDGENWGSYEDDVKNELLVEKDEDFIDWDVWKDLNKKGFDCVVSFERRNDRLIMTTVNQGIHIRNTTHISSDVKVFAALTGDQVALTDIRIVK